MRELDALIRRHNALTQERLELACLTGGIAASAAYTAAGVTKQGGGVFTPEDFLPGKQHARQTPEEVMEVCEVLTAGFGGKLEVHHG